MRNHFARTAAAVVATVGLAVAGACGQDAGGTGVASLGGGKSGKQDATTTTLPPADAMVAYARCMRDNGIPMKDPEPGTGALLRVGEHDPEAIKKADDACKHLMPKGTVAEESGEIQDQLRQMARCLRDKGFDIPDPKLAEPGSQGGGEPAGEPDVDLDDPAFKAAERECSNKAGLEAPPDGAERREG